MFIAELGISKAQRNVRANEMRLPQVEEEVLDLARDWQPCRE